MTWFSTNLCEDDKFFDRRKPFFILPKQATVRMTVVQTPAYPKVSEYLYIYIDHYVTFAGKKRKSNEKVGKQGKKLKERNLEKVSRLLSLLQHYARC